MTIRRSRSTLGDKCMSTARVCMRSKEIKRKRVGADVVSKDLDVRQVYLAQKPQLEVRGDHASGRPNDLGQPGVIDPRPTDLQTPGAPADSKTVDSPLREGVETLLQQLKTARFVLGGMRERVVRGLTHDQNRKPGSLRRRGAARGDAHACSRVKA